MFDEIAKIAIQTEYGAVAILCILILVVTCCWLVRICLYLVWLKIKQQCVSSVIKWLLPSSRKRSRRTLTSSTFGQHSRGLHIVVAVFGLFMIEPHERLGSIFSTAASHSSERSISGRVTHVRDGDTIEVAGVPIRFARLDCAELGTPAGKSAKRRMTALTRGKRAQCTLTGRRSYDRQIGECTVDRQNLSSAMVRDGYCTWWR